jgi:hypothetical protein
MIPTLVSAVVMCFGLYVAMGVITVTTLADSAKEDATWQELLFMLFVWPVFFFGE